MENMRRDISKIKEFLGRLDERTEGLPKVLRYIDKDISSMKVKIKLHFWILGVIIIAIGGIANAILLSH